MIQSVSKPVRVTRIQLKNWRNFRAVDVSLQSRVFVIGPNASGKSNLLDVFRFLRDIVSVGGGFQEAVRIRGGVSSIRCLAARKTPDIEVCIDLGHDNDLRIWSYELAFSQDSVRTPQIRREVVNRGQQEILRRPLPEDEEDPQRLTQTYLEQINANKEFREIADFFASTRYLHIVPQLVREPDRSSGLKRDPFGGDFLEQIAKTTPKTQGARLKKIRQALQAVVPQLKELELWRDEKGVPHLRGKYEQWRPQGAWQTEERFSDGTLRLMGLLWASLEGSGPLLLEEPELSLHRDAVRLIPQMLAKVQRHTGRQMMISTHSPDLLSDEGIGLDEVLVLDPTTNGTEIKLAGEHTKIKPLIEGGSTMADAAIPLTTPKQVQLLLEFPEKW